MFVDSQWNGTILAVELQCVELMAAQLCPLNISTVSGFCSCKGIFINREINWLIVNNGVGVVWFML